MRLCTECNVEKPFDSFHKDKKGYLGLKNKCKGCAKRINSKRYEDKKEHILSLNKAWRDEIMQDLEIKCCDGYDDILTICDNHIGEKAGTEVHLSIAEWGGRRTVHEASVALNKEQAEEVVVYLNDFFNLEQK